MSDLKNTFRRLEKIRATLEQLVVENQNIKKRLRKREDPQVSKIRRLEAALSASNLREEARERVLIATTQELERLKRTSSI